ncbi:MAG TPA: hypothetical protein VJ347_07435 [Streptosporangiaceae bacterium]|jgi:hypothetical protein|nr:hypothetical protein [Streptosporangiaceae bacterium]
MVLVRETVAGDWQALRDIRLEALRDAEDQPLPSDPSLGEVAMSRTLP